MSFTEMAIREGAIAAGVVGEKYVRPMIQGMIAVRALEGWGRNRIRLDLRGHIRDWIALQPR